MKKMIMPKYFMKFNGNLFKEVDFEFTLNHTSPTYLKLYEDILLTVECFRKFFNEL